MQETRFNLLTVVGAIMGVFVFLIIGIAAAYQAGRSRGASQMEDRLSTQQRAILADPNGLAAQVSLSVLEKLEERDEEAVRSICVNTIVGYHNEFRSAPASTQSPYISNLLYRVKTVAGKSSTLRQELARNGP